MEHAEIKNLIPLKALGRLDGDDRLDEAGPPVGDRPRKRARLGVDQQDGGADAVEQR